MSIIKCPKCQHDISSMVRTCPHCATPIAGNLVRCEYCKTYTLYEYATCPTCGKPLPERPATEDEVTAGTTPPTPPTRKKKRRRKWGCLLRMVLFLLIAGAAGAGYYYWQQYSLRQKEEADFALLADVTNPHFYAQFLEEHPASPHADEVRRRMEQLQAEAKEWDEVLREKKRISLLRFQQQHPHSLHARECRDMIDSIDWDDAVNIWTVEAMQDYLANHPDGLFAAEASDMLNKISQARITPEERSVVRGIYNDFFTRGMARQDSACIAEVIPDTMIRFCATPAARPNQILSFTREKMRPDVIGVHYLIDPDMRMRRETLEDGTLGLAVDFNLEETVSCADASVSSFHTYRVTSLMNAERKIVQMNIRP